MSEKETNKPRLLVYAPDRMDLFIHPTIESAHCELVFKPFVTKERFDSFDGVCLFQGSFETITTKSDGRRQHYNYCEVEKDELDKRRNELRMLLNNGGFACVVLSKPIIDYDTRTRKSFKSTDMAKLLLNESEIRRSNFQDRLTGLKIIRDEFRVFLEKYGATQTYFEKASYRRSWRVIAELNRKVVSMALGKCIFVPALLPEENPEKEKEYFLELSKAVLAMINNFRIEIPEWLDKHLFDDEMSLIQKRIGHRKAIKKIEQDLQEYKMYKRILSSNGDLLVEAVGYVLANGFGLKLDATDEYREDMKILNDDGKPVILVEIKGTNKGVSREKVNQADNHRERAELPVEFPAVLIINTNIKNANSIEDKDVDVAKEQVTHAYKNHVVILRTYDLLGLLRLYLSGKLTQEDVIQKMSCGGGWLKVTDDEIELLTK